jgi:hypothetical protein
VFSGLTIGTLLNVWGFIIALLDRLETGANSIVPYSSVLYIITEHPRSSPRSYLANSPETRQRPITHAPTPPEERALSSPEHHELALQPHSPPSIPLNSLPPAVDASISYKVCVRGDSRINQRDCLHAQPHAPTPAARSQMQEEAPLHTTSSLSHRGAPYLSMQRVPLCCVMSENQLNIVSLRFLLIFLSFIAVPPATLSTPPHAKHLTQTPQ